MTLSNTQKKWLILLASLALIWLAADLRFHRIAAQSLWNDEGNSYVQATRSFSAIAENAARDIHPPAYYWLLALWTKFLGTSEFGLRSLSAFASVLSVTFTLALGKRLFGGVVGLLAALFVALNTFSIFYAQEARMYALLALWSAASLWAFIGWIQTRRRRDGLLFALFNVGGLWTHYAFPFVMATEGVLFLVAWIGTWRKRPSAAQGQSLRLLRDFVALNLLTLILFAPWLPTALDQIRAWPRTGHATAPLDALATLLGLFAFGVTARQGLTIAAAFFLLFGLIQVPDEHKQAREWSASLPVLWVMLSVIAFLALDLFRDANLKFLLPAQIGFALWLALGIAVLWQVEPREDERRARWIPKLAAGVGALSVIVSLWGGIAPLYDDPAYQRDNYRAIAQTIETSARANDAIILNAPGQAEAFGYYYRGDLPVYPIPRGYGGDDAATLAELETIITAHERLYAVLWGTEERDPHNVVESTLDAQAYEADSTWYGDVRLVHYVTPVESFAEMKTVNAHFGDSITLESFAISAETFAPGDVAQVQLTWISSAPLETRYKVFVQLLHPDGTLAAQRDAEPVGGDAPTPTWTPDTPIIDRHALIIPDDLPPAHYALIVGLYNFDDASARLALPNGDDFLPIGEIVVTRNE